MSVVQERPRWFGVRPDNERDRNDRVGAVEKSRKTLEWFKESPLESKKVPATPSSSRSWRFQLRATRLTSYFCSLPSSCNHSRVSLNHRETLPLPCDLTVTCCSLIRIESKSLRGALLVVDLSKKRTATCAPPSFEAQPHINPSHLHHRHPLFVLFSHLYTHTPHPDFHHGKYKIATIPMLGSSLALCNSYPCLWRWQHCFNLQDRRQELAPW